MFISKNIIIKIETMDSDRQSNQLKNVNLIKSKNSLQKDIDWEDLVFNLRHIEIRILEIIYLPEPKPLALNTLFQKTKRLNYSERTIRRKIHKLETLGLINVVRSTIMIINPILNLHKNIKKLTVLWNLRDRNL